MASDTDWERIGAEVRAGQFSIREIGRQHGVSDTAIRKKAKEKGWTRDLSDKVREAVRIKTVRGLVRGEAGTRTPTDEEIIEIAAERGAQVQTRHQAMLETSQDLCARLIDRVKIAVVDIEGAEPAKTQAARMQAMAIAARAAELLDVLVRTTSKVIPLERQAFNLDAAKDAGGSELVSTAEKLRAAQREMQEATIGGSDTTVATA